MYIISKILINCGIYLRLDSNIESKSLNNTYLNIIEIFNKLSRSEKYPTFLELSVHVGV